VILIGFPTMVFLLKNPPKTGQATAISSFGRGVGETLRSHVYWILLLATTLGAGCMVAATERIVPALTDRGFPLSLAVSVLAIIPLVGGFAGVFVGWLLDRTLIPWAAAPLYGAAIVGMLLIEYGHGQVAMLAGGVFLGVGVGAEFAILPLLVSRYFGVRNYAGIISITYAAISLSTSLFPFLMDKTFDASGSYAKAFDYMAIALLIGAALIVFLPRLKHPGIGTSRSTGAALALDGLENRALSD
jgi:cyanate permease